MGNLKGTYDAKKQFSVGQSSLHSCMIGHGPDHESYTKSANQELKPEKYPDVLSFMWETYLQLSIVKNPDLVNFDDSY